MELLRNLPSSFFTVDQVCLLLPSLSRQTYSSLCQTGGGADDKDARRFNPALYNIVLFDQRGCGESTPPSCLIENETKYLVEDIEKIREHLKIDTWDVFG